MGAQQILNDIMEIGVSLRVDGNQLIAQPSSKLTEPLRIKIRQHKPELIKALSQHETPKLSITDEENIQEQLDERAAIMQFDGGLTRPEAERQAKSNMRVFHYRITDKPDSWLMMIAPGCQLTEVRRSLKSRFRERLIEVKEYQYSDGV